MNKGEIWIAEFPRTNGHEQAGSRPVIVIADVESITINKTDKMLKKLLRL